MTLASWSVGPTSRIHYSELTGMLVPWRDGVGPVFILLGGLDRFRIPCFSTPEKLCAFMAQAALSFTKIKEVTDGSDFVRSFPTKIGDVTVRVVMDPWFTPSGTVRYKEVVCQDPS